MGWGGGAHISLGATSTAPLFSENIEGFLNGLCGAEAKFSEFKIVTDEQGMPQNSNFKCGWIFLLGFLSHNSLLRDT